MIETQSYEGWCRRSGSAAPSWRTRPGSESVFRTRRRWWPSRFRQTPGGKNRRTRFWSICADSPASKINSATFIEWSGTAVSHDARRRRWGCRVAFKSRLDFCVSLDLWPRISVCQFCFFLMDAGNEICNRNNFLIGTLLTFCGEGLLILRAQNGEIVSSFVYHPGVPTSSCMTVQRSEVKVTWPEKASVTFIPKRSESRKVADVWRMFANLCPLKTADCLFISFISLWPWHVLHHSFVLPDAVGPTGADLRSAGRGHPLRLRTLLISRPPAAAATSQVRHPRERWLLVGERTFRALPHTLKPCFQSEMWPLKVFVCSGRRWAARWRSPLSASASSWISW